MSIDNLVTALSFIIAAGAFILSIRKQGSDVNNSDADTITQMFTNFKEQEVRYKALRNEFDAYRADMNDKFAMVVSENVKLRSWARNLVRQLEQTSIVPIKYEE